MSGKSLKIADVKSAELYRAMTEVDQNHHHTDGKIKSKKEWADLADRISGSEKLKAELANESNDVKALLGFTASAPASKTEAAAVTNPNKDLENYAKLRQEYDTLRKAGKGPYEAYKEVKNAHKDEKDYKQAIKAIKNYAKNVDSQIDMIQAIDKSDATKSKQVKKDAKAVLAKQDGGKIDKWHKRAANGSNNFVTWISGEDSAMKEVRKGQAWGNRAKQIEKDGVSMEAIVDKLGKKCPYLQTTESGKTLLEEAGLIRKRKDGVYDITELSHFIQNMGTGGDNNQSRQENKSVREAKLNIAELNAYINKQTGVDLSQTRIKDKYSKRLVELTGRHVEGKNVLGTVYANTAGGALAAAAGTVGALLMQKRDVTIVRNNNTNYLELNLSFEGGTNIREVFDSFANDSAFASLIEKGEATLTQTGDGVQVIIDQRNSDEIIRIADKHLLTNALKSAAIGGAIGLLASALTYGKSEQEVIPHVTDCKTLDEFNTYIDSLVTNKAVKPLYGEIAKRIAVAYSNKDGSINCDEMNKFLGYQASNGSRLNRAELMAALNNLKKELDKPVQTIPEEKTYCAKGRPIDGEEIKVEAPKTEKFEDWRVFASRYNCLMGKDPDFKYVYDDKLKKNVPNRYATTMMKVMQAITDDNYNWSRLRELTLKAMSKNWETELKDIAGFNLNIFNDLRGYKDKNGIWHFAMDKQNMPKITNVNGQGDCDYDAPSIKIGNQSGGIGKRTNLGNANNKSKGNDGFDGTITTSDGQTIKSTSKEQQNTQIKQLQEEGYKKANDC